MTTAKFKQAISEIVKAGGRPFLIGGAVRDMIQGIDKPKDLDIEVFGLTADQLTEALNQVGQPNIDDRKFGVIRLDCDLPEAVEFALPRKENNGERGFGGIFPNLSAEEACLRRDFTFNALSQDLVTGDIIDPLDGRSDLENGIIRHCDDSHFGEDTLRAIRGFRFAGLLNAKAAPETKSVIKAMLPDVKKLSGSAIWSEFEKWASRSVKPSMGLKFLVDTELIGIFPEIEALIGCPQDPEWHPEGDVFSHTCHVLDAAAGKGIVVVLAALCHDFGKPQTTVKNEDGRWISPKHAQLGEAPTMSFLASIGTPKKVTDQVVELVKEHMVHVGSGNDSKRKARRLLVRLEHAEVDDLFKVIEADHSGRPPLPKGLPEGACHLLVKCEEVAGQVEPLVLGRHLIAKGLKPGPAFGPILRKAFQAQLDGLFSSAESGIDFLKADIKDE